MSDRAIRLARLEAERGWVRWSKQQVQRRQATVTRLESSGFYEGYDAEQERHQIRLLNGRLVLAESITTSGQASGDPVVVSRVGGWRFKTMPRA